MSELTTITEPVSVVEIVTGPAMITQIIGAPEYGVVEVRDVLATLETLGASDVQTLAIVTAGPIGPRGPIGPQGPQGPFAPIFEQHFADPSLMWVIHHDLGVIPVVTLYDENHEEIVGDVMTPDRNTVIVTFEVPFAGTARLKA